MYYNYPDYYSGDRYHNRYHNHHCHHGRYHCENYNNILLLIALTTCRNTNRTLPLFWS